MVSHEIGIFRNVYGFESKTTETLPAIYGLVLGRGGASASWLRTPFSVHSLQNQYPLYRSLFDFWLKKNTLKVLGWVEISLYEDEDLTVYQGLQCGLGFRPV